MKKPKIFIDCTSLNRGGGVSHYIEQLLMHMPPHITPILFVTSNFETEYITIRLPVYNILTRLIYEHILMPLIAFIQGGKAIFLPKSYAPILKILPSVVTIHDIIPQQDMGETFLARLYWKIQNACAANFADGIIFINEYVRKQFISKYRCNIDCKVIYNGFDTYKKHDEQYSEYILIPGAIKARKQTLTACRLAGLIKSKRPQKRIVLTGRMEDRSIIEHIKKEFPDILLAGYVNNSTMENYMNNAYVIIYMSDNEGFSLPVAEACYLGKPVICSDIPLHRYIYSDYPIYYNEKHDNNIGNIVSHLENNEEKTCKKQYWSETASSTFSFIDRMGKQA